MGENSTSDHTSLRVKLPSRGNRNQHTDFSGIYKSWAKNNFSFKYFLTEETLTDVLYDRPEPGQSVQCLWKLKECFSVLVLEIKKQTTS